MVERANCYASDGVQFVAWVPRSSGVGARQFDPLRLGCRSFVAWHVLGRRVHWRRDKRGRRSDSTRPAGSTDVVGLGETVFGLQSFSTLTKKVDGDPMRSFVLACVLSLACCVPASADCPNGVCAFRPGARVVQVGKFVRERKPVRTLAANAVERVQQVQPVRRLLKAGRNLVGRLFCRG